MSSGRPAGQAPGAPTPDELREIFERVADGVVVLDLDWNYRLVNTQGARLLGRTPEQLIGRNYKTEFPEALDQRFFAEYERAMRTGEPRVFEGHYRPWDRWFENRLHPGAHGLTIFFSDITERKRIEAELLKRQQGFETLAENLPDAVARYDRALRAIYINRAIERVTGLPPAYFIGRTIYELDIPETVMRQWEASLRRAFAGEEHEMQFGLPDTQGQEHLLHARLVPERNAEHGIETVLVTTRDVTFERAAEDALREAQRLESVGRLAGGIAHDFNNVLTAILGHADLLLSSLPPEGHEWREDAEEIRRSARRASELTRQLLAFSRHQVLQLRAVDAAAIIAGAERMLRRLLPADIVFEVVAGGRWWVRTDPAQLEQGLVNLVVNARDAVAARDDAAGGTIAVHLAACHMGTRLEAVSTADARAFAPLDAPPAPAASLAPGDYAALVVRDSGVGMDLATRMRVFEPFFTTKAAGRGTGLGLASVHGFATQSGGAVALASAPGRGTMVVVYLPVAEPPAIAVTPTSGRRPVRLPREAAEAARSGEGQRGRILVVEDEAAVRTTTRRILAAGGYAVTEARHGADALRRWDEARKAGTPFDLVVTDLVMPEMTGVVLLDRLRERAADVRVLVVSGYDADATRWSPDDLPVLMKPYTSDALLAAVARALAT
jgi:two-component system, cell cycle sensor histidine kinase and response regulator CckA